MTSNRIQEIATLTQYKKKDKKSEINPSTFRPSALRQAPKQDVFQRSEQVSASTKPKTTSKVTAKTKVQPKKTQSEQVTQKKLDIILRENILTPEVTYFLKPKADAKNQKTFTQSQTNVINAAYDKLKFFKTFSKELSADAQEYGPAVLTRMQNIFGGEYGYGKYLELRNKDNVSVYNKLVKEFKNERVKNEIHNIFSKKLYNKQYAFLDEDEKELVKLSIADGDVKLEAKDYKSMENAFKTNPKNELAQRIYTKHYHELNNDEKKHIKELVYENPDILFQATTAQARREARDWVKDLVGLRLVLPTGSAEELANVTKYIDEAIDFGYMNITRFSNYHGSHILPYIKKEAVHAWSEKLPGMELVENSQVRKKNGYTTTQMNIEQYFDNHKDPIFVELQIRTKALNKIGNIEHLIYDILQNKDISKGIPELQAFYDSIGIVNAVKDVFKNPKLEEKYSDYERAYYSYLRNEEEGKPQHTEKPLLMSFGLPEYEYLLSFEALEGINNKAEAIKAKYGKAQQSPNQNQKNTNKSRNH